MNVVSSCRRLFLAGTLIACTSAASRAADPLVWKLEPGLSNHYEMTQDMEMKMNFGGGETKTVISQIINSSWTVKSINEDGSAVLDQRIDRMRMTIVAGDNQKTEADSDSEKPAEGLASMLAPLLKEMTSNSFSVTMTPRGEIIAVEIPEALIKAMQTVPGANMMGDLVTEEGFKKLIQQSSFALPEKLEPGVEWTATAEIKNPAFGKQIIETTYHYEGPRVVDGVNMEVFTPTLVIRYEGGEGAAANIEIVGQESSGEILFNRDAGRMESQSIKQGMDQKFKVQAQEITLKLDQNVVTKWVTEEEEM